MKYIIRSARPQFLILAPVCVFAGLVAGLLNNAPIDFVNTMLAFIGGILAHASVNLLNEYEDFKTGLDEKTIKTPFSGGTGNLQENPEQANTIHIAGWVAAGITAAIGIIITLRTGLGLLPVGILGLVTIVIYTSFINKFPWLCLISPGLGFGTFMVMGTEYAVSGQYTWTGFLISLVPFFLVNNLLLLNQFPDMEPDKSIGRKHFLVTYGRKNSAIVYTAFLIASYVVLTAGAISGLFSWGALFGLATIFIAIPAVKTIFNNLNDMPKLASAQGMNVMLNLFTPLLAGIGMLVIK